MNSSSKNDFVSIHLGASTGYSSEFEEDKNEKSDNLLKPTQNRFLKNKGSNSQKQTNESNTSSSSASTNSESEAKSWIERKKSWGASLRGMNAYDRHKKYINDYILFYGKKEEFTKPTTKHKTDWDILKEEHRFIRTDEDNDEKNWEKRMARSYYDKLFKEYCLADMRKYKEGKIGLRWRTEKEVLSGKGQFVCGNLYCEERKDLKSYEVNFHYVEQKEHKNALVKLRVCPDCAKKMGVKDKPSKKRKAEEGEKEEEIEEQKEDNTMRQKEKSSKRKKLEKESETVERSSSSSTLWKQKPEQEKTQDQEFDEYFDGLFL